MSRKRKPRREAQPQVVHVAGDIGTPELHKREVVDVRDKRAYVASVTAFDLYHRRGWISDAQHTAAEELLRCAIVGGIIERGRSCIAERILGIGSYSDYEGHCRQRYRKGMAAIGKLELQSFTFEVVVRNVTVGEAARAIGVTRQGEPMGLLREALDDVARAYGIAH
jgi:hypothetical protein